MVEPQTWVSCNLRALEPRNPGNLELWNLGTLEICNLGTLPDNIATLEPWNLPLGCLQSWVNIYIYINMYIYIYIYIYTQYIHSNIHGISN